MDYGAGKYGQHNWSKYAGRWAWTQLIASCLRHLFAWMMGEDLDEESGLNHLAHALANICMLLDLQIMDKGTDDRNPVYWDDGQDEDVLHTPTPSELEANQHEVNMAWTKRVDEELAKIHLIPGGGLRGVLPVEEVISDKIPYREIPDEELHKEAHWSSFHYEGEGPCK
jgi:hypothetical protein